MAEVPAQVGPYTIEREIGRGGMGVVFLGRDTKLDRDVAVKALPEHLAEDPERLARFEREAKTLAQLSHPNVAGIYGVEEQEGRRFLVLEYVEGETLGDRLDHGAMAVDEALEVCAQIAAGVEAAHEAGVVHRDLKPANVKLTSDGRVKVLDFGLAKSAEGHSSSSSASQIATMTNPNSPTVPGVILGTAPYMSPEQARGRRVDKRTDIWSFGVILYECLTGAGPFIGETPTDSIGAILHKEVDLARLPGDTPAIVRHLLTRCLERDRSRRLRDIGDARIELETAGLAGGLESAETRTRGGLVAALPYVVIVALAFALMGAMSGLLPSRGAERMNARTIRLGLPLVLDRPGAGERAVAQEIAISPDGSKVVVNPVGFGKLIMRDLNSFEVREIPGTDDAWAGVFSPDGRWICYGQRNTLYRVPVDGGPPLPIGDVADLSGDPVWPDPEHLYMPGEDYQSIYRITVDDGELELLSRPIETPGVVGIVELCSVPGQPYLLVDAYSNNTIDDYEILRISTVDGSVDRVLANAASPRVCSSGHMVFRRDSTLLAVPFDFDTGTVTGPERRVLDGVLCGEWGDSPLAALSWSGDLVYVPGRRLSDGRRLAVVDQQGGVTPITEPDFLADTMAVNADGSRIAMSTLRRSLEAWTFEPASGRMQRFNTEGEVYNFQWDSTGSRLAFLRHSSDDEQDGGDLILRDFGAGGTEQVVRKLSDTWCEAWLPGDTGLLLQTRATEADPDASFSLRRILFEAPEEISEMFDAGRIWQAKFSPDGRWLAYIEAEAGTGVLYVRNYPELDRRWQVSFGEGLLGGVDPMWSADSGTLFWASEDWIVKADLSVTEDGALEVGAQERLFENPWPHALSRWSSWDAGPDDRFYVVMPAEWEQRPREMRVILNWDEELRAATAPRAE